MRKYLPYLSLLFAVLFIALATVVSRMPELLGATDTFVQYAVQPLQTNLVLNIFLIVAQFGSLFGILAGLVFAIYFYRHRPDLVARLCTALLGATISGEYLKDFIHRARPTTLHALQPLYSYSFPSGHSNESLVFYGFFALFLYVHAPTKLRKFFAVAIPALMILLIGFSRIVLNYHYASDVLGGYLLGAFWLTFSLAIPLYHDVYHRDFVLHSEPIEQPLL